VPLLTSHDPLPWPPNRVLVTGVSGTGKTRLAATVGELWGLPRVELDALHHGEGWQPRPTFAEEVAGFADLVLWLDHPRWLVMWQVTRRTLARRIRREVLWNGNTEGPLHTFFTDRDHIVRWAWRTHGKPGRRVAGLLARRGAEVAVVRLRGRRQISQWVRDQQRTPR